MWSNRVRCEKVEANVTTCNQLNIEDKGEEGKTMAVFLLGPPDAVGNERGTQTSTGL